MQCSFSMFHVLLIDVHVKSTELSWLSCCTDVVFKKQKHSGDFHVVSLLVSLQCFFLILHTYYLCLSAV